MTPRSLKPEVQQEMLRDICKQLSEAPKDYLDGTAEDLLAAIVEVLDDQSQDDAWTTEGWKHYFGYDG